MGPKDSAVSVAGSYVEEVHIRGFGRRLFFTGPHFILLLPTILSIQATSTTSLGNQNGTNLHYRKIPTEWG